MGRHGGRSSVALTAGSEIRPVRLARTLAWERGAIKSLELSPEIANS
jgi:hypothetical protein